MVVLKTVQPFTKDTRMDGNDNEVVADIIDEAEVVHYAEGAHCMNYLQKFGYVIILVGIVVVIAIVFVALNEKVRADPRCDEWPLEVCQFRYAVTGTMIRPKL